MTKQISKRLSFIVAKNKSHKVVRCSKTHKKENKRTTTKHTEKQNYSNTIVGMLTQQHIHIAADAFFHFWPLDGERRQNKSSTFPDSLSTCQQTGTCPSHCPQIRLVEHQVHFLLPSFFTRTDTSDQRDLEPVFVLLQFLQLTDDF